MFLVDSSKTLMFEEMRRITENKTNKKSFNLDFDHNLIKKVNSESGILKQMGFSKSNIFKYLY